MSITTRFATIVAALALAAVARGQGIVEVAPADRTRPWPSPVATVEVAVHRIEVRIADTAARTTVHQTFRNPNGFEAEGIYLFPVPADASLTEFAMSMNGKMVTGEVLERDDARRIYEDIVRSRKDPGLLEYADRRLFRARVFPIPARGTVDVSLSYVETLAIANGLIEYRYPLRTQAFSKAPVGTVAIDVRIEASAGITTVFSSSHAVDVKEEGAARVLTHAAQNVTVDRDFALYVGLSDRAFGVGVLTTKPDVTEDGYFMLTLAPARGFDDVRVLPRDVVFVVDTSGSMRGHDKMAEARNALLHGLDSLSPQDRFDVVAFATETRSYGSALVEASSERREAAAAFVRGLEARGGTNIAGALDLAMSRFDAASDRVRSVVFVTDGMPTIGETRPDAILRQVGARNPEDATRLFVFGVGYDVNADLLDRLAEENAGSREYVTPSQNLEVALSRFFDRVSSPVLSGVEIAIEGVEVSRMHPRRIPDVFRGGEITLFGRYAGDGEATVRLSGMVNGDRRELTFRTAFDGEHAGRDFIPALWARREIGYLLDQIRTHGESGELKDEVVALAKRYGIATPYTSMLVLEDDAAVAGGPPRPQPRRDGFDSRGRAGGGAVPQGERRDPSGGPPFPGSGPGGGEVGAAPHAPGGGTSPFDTRSADAVGFGRAAAVESSIRRKALREAEVEELKEELGADGEEILADAEASPTVRRVGARTFHLRDDVWVEGQLLPAAGAERAEPDEAVAAFGKRYFELLRAHPEIAALLAEMPSLELKIDGRVIRFLPPRATPTEEKDGKEAEETPAAPAEKRPESPRPAPERDRRI